MRNIELVHIQFLCAHRLTFEGDTSIGVLLTECAIFTLMFMGAKADVSPVPNVNGLPFFAVPAPAGVLSAGFWKATEGRGSLDRARLALGPTEGRALGIPDGRAEAEAGVVAVDEEVLGADDDEGVTRRL